MDGISILGACAVFVFWVLLAIVFWSNIGKIMEDVRHKTRVSGRRQGDAGPGAPPEVRDAVTQSFAVVKAKKKFEAWEPRSLPWLLHKRKRPLHRSEGNGRPFRQP